MWCCFYLIMTKSCCAPRCRNWYKKNARRKRRKTKRRVTTLRKLKTKELLVMMKISMFEFPDHKTDQQRRATWIARVPRDNWHPKEDSNIFLCEDQFLSSDIVSASTDSNPRRKRKRSSGALSKKRWMVQFLAFGLDYQRI